MDFDYKRYLASREWAVLRETVKQRAGAICERCNWRPMSQVHHLTYERVGHELLTDLQGVCRECHEYLSAKREIDPASHRDISLVESWNKSDRKFTDIEKAYLASIASSPDGIPTVADLQAETAAANERLAWIDSEIAKIRAARGR